MNILAVLWLSLFFARCQAGLTIVSPAQLKESFGMDGEVYSKLSYIGLGDFFPKGEYRIGQVISPLNEDGQGCQQFDWDLDFTPEELKNFDREKSFFLLL